MFRGFPHVVFKMATWICLQVFPIMKGEDTVRMLHPTRSFISHIKASPSVDDKVVYCTYLAFEHGILRFPVFGSPPSVAEVGASTYREGGANVQLSESQRRITTIRPCKPSFVSQFRKIPTSMRCWYLREYMATLKC